jgi:hypothetical protein
MSSGQKQTAKVLANSQALFPINGTLGFYLSCEKLKPISLVTFWLTGGVFIEQHY